MKDINKDLEPKNPKEQIQKDYSDWVDRVCDECDWKTNITMDEVQAVYSRLAIELVIKELLPFAAEQYKESVNERIKYLQSLNGPTE